jgi:hypothetical protein
MSQVLPTSSAYTPAPWNYSNTAGSHQFAVYEQEIGQDIAIVYNRNEHSEANARLISAAPELLEACKYVIDSAIDFGAYEREFRILSSAIAKAEVRT